LERSGRAALDGGDDLVGNVLMDIEALFGHRFFSMGQGFQHC
jgi:hypothetical protein